MVDVIKVAESIINEKDTANLANILDEFVADLKKEIMEDIRQQEKDAWGKVG